MHQRVLTWVCLAMQCRKSNKVAGFQSAKKKAVWHVEYTSTTSNQPNQTPHEHILRRPFNEHWCHRPRSGLLDIAMRDGGDGLQ